jgi:hypothetical protein
MLQLHLMQAVANSAAANDATAGCKQLCQGPQSKKPPAVYVVAACNSTVLDPEQTIKQDAMCTVKGATVTAACVLLTCNDMAHNPEHQQHDLHLRRPS